MIKLQATNFDGRYDVTIVECDEELSSEYFHSPIELSDKVKSSIPTELKGDVIIIVDSSDLELKVDNNSTVSFFMKATKVFVTGYKSFESITTTNASAKNIDVLKLIQNDARYKCPTPDEDGWYVEPNTWKFLIASYLTNKHILLRGDTGSGKTELVRLIASRCNRDLDIIDMSILDGRTALCGSTKLIGGDTVIKPARFAQQIAKNSFILLDELSRADSFANNVLLPVLDSRKTLHMEELGDIDNIKRNDDCIIWATANIGIEYSGTQNIDEAISNRFTQVILEYAPLDSETDILIYRTGINRRAAKMLAQLAEISRTNNQITHPISTRQLLVLAEYVALGFDISVAVKQCLGAIYSGRGDNSLDLMLATLK